MKSDKHVLAVECPRWWWNIPIILLIGILVPLGIRSIVTGDNRYGWGTFSTQVNFELSYYWVMEDGSATPYKSGNELRGEARKKLKSGYNNTRYSLGAVRSWLEGYARYMYEHRPNDDIKAFRAVCYYQLNVDARRRIDRSEERKIVVQYPAPRMR